MTVQWGVDALCRSCRGTGQRNERQCLSCAGTGVVREPQAVARRDDPETSVAAAASVERIRASQLIVLEALRYCGPMTDEKLVSLPVVQRSMSESGARTRRSELVGKGLVVDSGRRERLASGRRSIVWMASE